MKRSFLVLSVAAIAALTLTVAAFAANPQFNQGPTYTTTFSPADPPNATSVSISVSFKAVGLGNTVGTVDWNVAVTGTISWRCYNKGNNTPQAANKQEAVNANVNFTSDVRNGQTTVTNEHVATLTSTLRCPGNQEARIESLSLTLTLTGQGLTDVQQVSFP